MYDDLYNVWSREKKKEYEIQQLPKNFYPKIAVFIKKLKEENRMLDKKTLKARLLRDEFDNVKVMVEELFLLRYRKFRTKVFTQGSIARDALTEEEKKLYCDVSTSAEACSKFSKDILRGYLPKIEKAEKQKITVLRFVKEIPNLIGIDMKTYGPFYPEDIATLPIENARIFIKKEKAVEIDPN